MRAVIYARKSNDQDVSDDAKSVTRQIELSRAFATSKGWTVAEEFSDDGISGVMATKLVSRARMLAAAAAEAFSVLVVRDLDRLSRNDEELPSLIYTLRDAGVEIWCYADGQRVDTQTAMHRGMLSMKATFAAAEREAAQQRTREALRAKARHGHVTGGAVYGYDSVRDGSHVRRVINETQAAIIRRVFTMTAEGQGQQRIAKRLNAEGVPAPRRAGWASTSLHEMLRRDLYRGLCVYGKTRHVYQRGSKRRVPTPQAEWITVEAPQLRIIPADLWQKAQARLERTRQTYTRHRKKDGTLQGRPESGLLSRHLLAGFLRCGLCGGSLFVAPREARLYFLCTARHKTGSKACRNRFALSYEAITESVLDHFREGFLSPEVIGRLLMDEINAQKRNPDEAKAQRQAVEADLKKLDREVARLVEAVASGDGEVRPLVDAMKTKQRLRDDVAARLEHLDGLEKAASSFDVVEWLEETRELLEDLKNTLEADSAAGRGVLRSLLVGPLTVTPEIDEAGRCVAWTYQGDGRLDKVLAGRLPGQAPAPGGCTDSRHNNPPTLWLARG